MKTLTLIALVLFFFSTFAFADSVIVTETSSWKDIPITVNSTNNTYTVTGVIPTDTTNYYYSYSGYRCIREKREIAGVSVLTLKAGMAGGSDIYCYPVP